MSRKGWGNSPRFSLLFQLFQSSCLCSAYQLIYYSIELRYFSLLLLAFLLHIYYFALTLRVQRGAVLEVEFGFGGGQGMVERDLGQFGHRGGDLHVRAVEAARDGGSGPQGSGGPRP